MKDINSAETWQNVLKEFDRAEHAQQERDRSNGMTFSLDDPFVIRYIESHCDNAKSTPEHIVIRKIYGKVLKDSLKTLSPEQQRRINKYFWENMSYSEIAEIEGVDESAVRRSIGRALVRLRKTLCNTGISPSDFTEHSVTRYIKHTHRKIADWDTQVRTYRVIKFNDGGNRDET